MIIYPEVFLPPTKRVYHVVMRLSQLRAVVLSVQRRLISFPLELLPLLHDLHDAEDDRDKRDRPHHAHARRESPSRPLRPVGAHVAPRRKRRLAGEREAQGVLHAPAVVCAGGRVGCREEMGMCPRRGDLRS